MYVVGAASGRRRLLYPTGRGLHVGASPVVQGERAYFGSSGGRVSAIEGRHITWPLERYLFLWRSRLFLWGILQTLPEQKGRVWSTRIGGDVTQPPAVTPESVVVVRFTRRIVTHSFEHVIFIVMKL